MTQVISKSLSEMLRRNSSTLCCSNSSFQAQTALAKKKSNCRKRNHQIPDKNTEPVGNVQQSGTINKHQRIMLFVVTKVKRPIHLQGKKKRFQQKKNMTSCSHLWFPAFKKHLTTHILSTSILGVVLPFVKSLHTSFWIWTFQHPTWTPTPLDASWSSACVDSRFTSVSKAFLRSLKTDFFVQKKKTMQIVASW